MGEKPPQVFNAVGDDASYQMHPGIGNQKYRQEVANLNIIQSEFIGNWVDGSAKRLPVEVVKKSGQKQSSKHKPAPVFVVESWLLAFILV